MTSNTTRRLIAPLLGTLVGVGALTGSLGARPASAVPMARAATVPASTPGTWSLAGDFPGQWNSGGGPQNSASSTWQYLSVPTASEGTPGSYTSLPTASPGCGASAKQLDEYSDGTVHLDYAVTAVAALCGSINAQPGAVFMDTDSAAFDDGVSWTSPFTGDIAISGSVDTRVGGGSGGNRKWSLWLGDANSPFTSATVGANTTQDFTAGSGGSGALQVHVTAGQKVYFLLNSLGDTSYENTGVQFVISRSGSYSSTLLAQNPQGYYRLGDTGLPTGSATAVSADYSDTPTNGTYPAGGDVQTVPGAIVGDSDQAVKGDGTGAVMQAPAQSLPSGTAIRSIQMWVQFPASDAGKQESLLQYGTTGAGGQELTLQVGGDQGQTFTAFSDHRSVGTWTSNRGLYDGTWHLLSVVYDQNQDTTLYLDSRDLGVQHFGLNTGTAQPVMAIGVADGDGGASFANGAFDEVAVFGYTIDAYSIYAQLGSSGRTPPASSTVAATGGPSSLTVSWSPVPAVDQYVIAVYPAGGSALTWSATVPASAACSPSACVATMAGLDPTGSYVASVYATNSYGIGQEAYSSTVSLTSGSPGYVSSVLEDSPVAYYRMDEPVTLLPATNDNWTAGAGSPSSDGAYVDTNVQLGAPGALGSDPDPAVTATGVGPAMSASAAGFPAGGDPRTVEMWVKLPASDATSSRALFRYGTTNGSELAFDVAGDGKTLEESSGGVAGGSWTSPGLYDGKWHYLAVAYAAGQQMTVYVDGISLGSRSVSVSTGTSSPTFDLGAADNSSLYSNGSFDEVAVYATALSTSRIQSHFQAGQAAADHVSVSVTSATGTDRVSSVAPGTPVDVTVTAVDATGHPLTTYTGTAHFASTDPAAVLPDDFKFGAAEGGTHTFQATLETPGSQTVTVTDTTKPTITGSSSPVTVTGRSNGGTTGGSPPPAPTSAPPPPGVNGGDTTPAQSGTAGSGTQTDLSGSSQGTTGQVTVQPAALPNGTVVTEFLVDPSAFKAPSGTRFVGGYAVSWQAPDGTAPDASSPIVLQIHAAPGDTIYLVQPDGTLQKAATVGPDGLATVTFTKDPAFLVAQPLPTTTPPPNGPAGYRLIGADGGVFDFGSASFHGSLGGRALPAPIVGSARTPDGAGYWMAGSDGSVYPFGDAESFGSLTGRHLTSPIVDMASTPDGRGYWLVASDGGVFSFGDAGFFGSTGGIRLDRPIVGMGSSPDGGGYWLVASDGGVFSFGDAGFFGSTGGIRLDQPVVGMVPAGDGAGYWLIARDGGVFSFGDARFQGSTGAIRLASPMVTAIGS